MSIACDDNEFTIRAREIISENIKGLINSGFIEILIPAIIAVRNKGFWAEGWKQLCMTIHFDSKKWPTDTQAKVEKLEQDLRPASLEDRFSTYVTNAPWGFYPVDSDIEEETNDRVIFIRAEKVGVEAAKLPSLWPSLMKQTIAYSGQSASKPFGRGLAKGAADVFEMWSQLTLFFCESELETRNADVLCGFLEGAHAREPDTVQNWLDGAVTDDALGPHIVELSISLPLDRRSTKRLTRAVKEGKAPLQSYHSLGCGRATDPTPIDDLIEFLRVLFPNGDIGIYLVTFILNMYFFGHPEESDVTPELLAFGRELLQSGSIYQNKNLNRKDYLERIARRCLAGEENEQSARNVCEKLLKVPSTYLQ